MPIKQRLSALREKMQETGIDCYVITKNDPHQSEYVSEFWNGVKFITGFTGSFGFVVVSKEAAVLWTDGRYSIQAERQLEGTGISLFVVGDAKTPELQDYLKATAPVGGSVGFDGRTISKALADKLFASCKEKGININSELDLLTPLWDNRPQPSKSLIFELPVSNCGKSRLEKLAEVREKMEDADIYLISSLDDIAWLFNLRAIEDRGSMCFPAYTIVEKDNVSIFVDSEKLGNIKGSLEQEGIQVRGYEEFYDVLKLLPDKKTIYCPEKSCCTLYNHIKHLNPKEIKHDITSQLKSIKNEAELTSIKKANLIDGLAMVKFIKWLKENVKSGELTEISITQRLSELRQAGEGYITDSFSTICAYMSNAAMMHYSATEESHAKVLPKGMLLVDSGGHYYTGTTDITRTIVLGEITQEMKRDFTLVLKAHINLASAIFLYGATGSNLDTLARQPIWEQAIDYKSGTGHGIGFCTSVHEGPQRISQILNDVKLAEGMIVTIEPGIYRKDGYGIRTENTAVVVPYAENEFGRFMAFEILSFCPIDLSAVDFSMLSDKEKNWLKNYHKQVYDSLSQYLTDEEAAWLRNEINL